MINNTTFSVTCPTCGKKIDSHLAVGEGSSKNILPKEGDLSICIYCASGMRFNKDLGLELFNENIKTFENDKDSLILFLRAKLAVVLGLQKKESANKEALCNT